MKEKIFFKAYLWIMVLLFPFTLFIEINDNQPSDFIDFLDFFLWAIALLGVWAYSYQKRIFSIKFWRYFLPIIFFWDVLVSHREINSDPGLLDSLSLVIIILIVFLLPQYLALYRYAYKND